MSTLEPFLLLAKSARGKAAASIIDWATQEAGVFVFGELLDMPGVKELAGTDHAPWLALLELFAYGTWADYKAAAARLPPLSEAAAYKLKQLTLASLAASSAGRPLPYPAIEAGLGLDGGGPAAVEAFITTGGLYPGLVTGRLDPAAGAFQVAGAAPRDARPEGVGGLVEGLRAWAGAARGVEARLRAAADRAVAGAAAAAAASAAACAAAADARAAALLDLAGGGGAGPSAAAGPSPAPGTGGAAAAAPAHSGGAVDATAAAAAVGEGTPDSMDEDAGVAGPPPPAASGEEPAARPKRRR